MPLCSNADEKTGCRSVPRTRAELSMTEHGPPASTRSAEIAWVFLDWAASAFSTILIALVVAYVEKIVDRVCKRRLGRSGGRRLGLDHGGRDARLGGARPPARCLGRPHARPQAGAPRQHRRGQRCLPRARGGAAWHGGSPSLQPSSSRASASTCRRSSLAACCRDSPRASRPTVSPPSASPGSSCRAETKEAESAGRCSAP